MTGRQVTVTATGFAELYARLRHCAGWGEQDRLGALNHISPVHVTAAARGVSAGQTVSLAAPAGHEVTLDNPQPCLHKLSIRPRDGGSGGMDFATDSLALNVHGNADSHFDALCHVSYDGTFYNDLPADRAGAAELSVDTVAERGIAARGVLLDIPRLRGIDWLEPGDHVAAAELTEAEKLQGVHVGAGDLLFVRVGHRLRRQVLGPWDAAAARAGLHPQAMVSAGGSGNPPHRTRADDDVGRALAIGVGDRPPPRQLARPALRRAAAYMASRD